MPKYYWYFGVTLSAMQEQYTVQEYANKMQVDISTVYRWSRQGKVITEKIDGVLHIVIDAEEMSPKDTNMPNSQNELVTELRQRILSLEKENETKNKQIESLNLLLQDAAESQKRTDTIILQLTRQFDEQTKLLEDMRQKQNAKWYQRLFRR